MTSLPANHPDQIYKAKERAAAKALARLREKIDNRTAKLAVIGLGYVGLPVACSFASAGFTVLGVEKNQERLDLINRGISPIEGNEPGLNELLRSVVPGKLRATSDPMEISGNHTGQGFDVVLIDVETPVEAISQMGEKVPRYEALRLALTNLGAALRQKMDTRTGKPDSGTLVIIESTLAPGTMDQVVRPLLDESSGLSAGKDYFLAHCPERVMPGKLLQNLHTINRVIGGMSPEVAETASLLYRHIVNADLDLTDCITAELVKTVENAYRDVQIAFANEVALICEATGGDVWKVRPLVNKSPFRQMHLPGAGVGGHCIPKDPWLLAYSVKDADISLRVIPAARQVNDGMPEHMIQLLADALIETGVEIQGARILVMGYSYLENSDDTRNSPSRDLVALLQGVGATVIVHDPYVKPYQGDLIALASSCDAAVVMVHHQSYVEIDLRALKKALKNPVLIDGRHVFNDKALVEKGWIYREVGVASR